MHGAIVSKRKSRAGYIQTVAVGPTLERLAKAAGHFTVGDDKQGGIIHTMRDAPLDRMFARDAIGGAEYAALQKYKHHWYHAGLGTSMGSVDLNRIFSSDPGSMSGMAKTEAQAHHRRQWREAREHIGNRIAAVVDKVVCAECTIEIAGYDMGWRNKPQAIAAATEMLRDAGYRLARLWEVAIEGGRVAAIVPTDHDAGAVNADGREVVVYTLEEIGRLLSAYPDIAVAKATFPGATVTEIRKTVDDPLNAIADTADDLNDEIGF